MLEYPRIHRDGRKSNLINSVSQQIHSLGTRFHSTNTLVQKIHRDATLRTAINLEFASMPGASFLLRRLLGIHNMYIQYHIPIALVVALIACWSP